MPNVLKDSNPSLVIFDGRFLPAEVVDVMLESEPNPIAPDVARGAQQYRVTLVTFRDPHVRSRNGHSVILCSGRRKILLESPTLSNINKQFDGSWEIEVYGTGHHVGDR